MENFLGKRASRIKKLLIGIYLITQIICTTNNNNIALASSEEHLGNCAKEDTLMITLVSAGIVVLEKIAEKVYKYFMAKYRNNHNNNTEQEDNNIQQDNNDGRSPDGAMGLL